jgi:hypothetical protein
MASRQKPIQFDMFVFHRQFKLLANAVSSAAIIFYRSRSSAALDFHVLALLHLWGVRHFDRFSFHHQLAQFPSTVYDLAGIFGK